MTTYYAIANWKMNLTPRASLKLAKQLKSKVKKSKNVKVVICPGFTALASVTDLLKKSFIKTGSQNISWEGEGAYTGEVSVKTLKELGCKYAIIGHSERRQYLKETDEMINKKVKQVLKSGLTPILCIGETLAQKKRGEQKKVLKSQLQKGLKGVKLGLSDSLIVAYEPIWAIGTGLTVSPEEAMVSYKFIRVNLRKILGKTSDKKVAVLYGGSVNDKNILDFVGKGKMQGGLVGGASLSSSKFNGIVKKLAGL